VGADDERLIPREEKRYRPATLWAGALGLAGLVGVLWYLHASGLAPRKEDGPLAFGAGEQAYASKMEFSGLEMSRAANMLNQEVTYLSGEISNQGGRKVLEIEVTIEFRDAMNQVVLRDQRRVLGRLAQPLASGERRDFQIAFDHVPADWNVQVPTVRISGLDLE